VRIGSGFDLHRLVEGRRLVLGGVEIPSERGLAGHSDADVLAHAVGDALLGALGAGDLGSWFPSSDPRWKEAPAAALLGPILERVRKDGFRVSWVDTTLVAERPRLAEHRERIREGLAGMLRLEAGRVNVKLKSADGLGAIGRGEGIAAQAVVLLEEETG
jgi:2-C-methyl-D-erythritol 2,4-cyclodiphosphate synthase